MSLFGLARRVFRRDGQWGGKPLAAIGSLVVSSRIAHRAVVLQTSLYMCALLGLHALPLPDGGSEAIATVLSGFQSGITSTILLATITSAVAPNRDLNFLGPFKALFRPDATGLGLYYEVLVTIIGPVLALLEGGIVVLQAMKLSRWMERKMRNNPTHEDDPQWMSAILAVCLLSYVFFGGAVYLMYPFISSRMLWGVLVGAAVLTALALINPDGNLADAALTLGYIGLLLIFSLAEVQLGAGIFVDATEKTQAALQLLYLGASSSLLVFTMRQPKDHLPTAARNILICIGVTFRLLVTIGLEESSYPVIIWRSAHVFITVIVYSWYMFFGESEPQPGMSNEWPVDEYSDGNPNVALHHD